MCLGWTTSQGHKLPSSPPLRSTAQHAARLAMPGLALHVSLLAPKPRNPPHAAAGCKSRSSIKR